MKLLCFKPTRNMHDSGFRYIEYGYIDTEDDTVEVIDRWDVLMTPLDTKIHVYIDLTKSGWFRIMPKDNVELRWGYGGQIEATPKERKQ